MIVLDEGDTRPQKSSVQVWPAVLRLQLLHWSITLWQQELTPIADRILLLVIKNTVESLSKIPSADTASNNFSILVITIIISTVTMNITILITSIYQPCLYVISPLRRLALPLALPHLSRSTGILPGQVQSGRSRIKTKTPCLGGITINITTNFLDNQQLGWWDSIVPWVIHLYQTLSLTDPSLRTVDLQDVTSLTINRWEVD